MALHYIVSNALQNNIASINTAAEQNDLCVCTLPEYYVNTGIIDVKVLSDFSNVNDFILRLFQLGFQTNYFPLDTVYWRILITGYLA
jgi:hypothetical protein